MDWRSYIIVAKAWFDRIKHIKDLISKALKANKSLIATAHKKICDSNEKCSNAMLDQKFSETIK